MQCAVNNVTGNPPSTEVADGSEVNRNWIDDHYEWEVDRILRHRMVDEHMCYLIRWLGYSPAWDSWEPVFHLFHAPRKVSEYYARVRVTKRKQVKRARARRFK